jgi:hypothetical protein
MKSGVPRGRLLSKRGTVDGRVKTLKALQVTGSKGATIVVGDVRFAVVNLVTFLTL